METFFPLRFGVCRFSLRHSVRVWGEEFWYFEMFTDKSVLSSMSVLSGKSALVRLIPLKLKVKIHIRHLCYDQTADAKTNERSQLLIFIIYILWN